MSMTVTEMVAALNTENPELAKARKSLAAAQAQVVELEARVEELSADVPVATEAAEKAAEMLLGAGLGEDAVMAALRTQFGRKPRSYPKGEDRKSHKLSEDARNEILGFISQHPEGVAGRDIYTQFSSQDRTGVALVVKALIEAGSVSADGNTQKRRYFPVV